MKDFYLGDQLVAEASRRFSLVDSLFKITSRLRSLFIHLLLKVRKHLNELVLGSIVPWPRGSRREDSPSPISLVWTLRMSGC